VDGRDRAEDPPVDPEVIPEDVFFRRWFSGSWWTIGSRERLRSLGQRNGNCILPRRHSERIVGHFWHRGTVAEQRIERCGAHPSDRREIAREGHGFIDADESLLAILAAVHLPEFIRAAELEAAIGEMAVIAPLVAVVVHTGNDPVDPPRSP